ncbi:hypothetical protein J7E93_00605 [Streptomyces sp. ISL-36]|uniref:hypothetical protein n=1 Tax=Streptomyces sp. ISL-36 TaxID=2819182 RepID=UPI001BEA82E5|nr:hypothetical protein [Streptomyces sp. ISL-36]MBT2438650.1 hypothetical protein [Streptomyces sp. ISL-36]
MRIASTALVPDHAAEAGAGGGEVVFKAGDSLTEFRVLGGRLPFRCGQPEVLLGELVDAVDQVVVAELFDLLPEVNAGLLPQARVFGSQSLDLLACEKKVGLSLAAEIFRPLCWSWWPWAAWRERACSIRSRMPGA